MSDPKTTLIAYTSAGSAVIFGFTANEFAALMGLAFAFGTFVINWYYKRQHLKIIAESLRREPFPKISGDEL